MSLRTFTIRVSGYLLCALRTKFASDGASRVELRWWSRPVEDGARGHRRRRRPCADAPRAVAGAHEQALGPRDRADEWPSIHGLRAGAHPPADHLRLEHGWQVLCRT